MKTVSSTAKPAEDKPAEDKPAQHEQKAKADALEDDELDEETDRPDGEKTAKKKKTPKAVKNVKTKKSKGDRKRGPARPYRKLPQETLESRIKKLEKRIERTSAQAEEGRSFLSKYTREQGFRDAEPVRSLA
jgi:hypothetical protein